jgi:hypothetical protein
LILQNALNHLEDDMTIKFSEIADSIHIDFQKENAARPYRSYSIQAVRDHCELRTNSDLDAGQLDILTDLVKARLEKDGIRIRM